MLTTLATAGASAPTVSSAISDTADVVSAAMSTITGQPVLLAMFGMALLIPAFKIIKRAKNTSK